MTSFPHFATLETIFLSTSDLRYTFFWNETTKLTMLFSEEAGVHNAEKVDNKMGLLESKFKKLKFSKFVLEIPQILTNHQCGPIKVH